MKKKKIIFSPQKKCFRVKNVKIIKFCERTTKKYIQGKYHKKGEKTDYFPIIFGCQASSSTLWRRTKNLNNQLGSSTDQSRPFFQISVQIKIKWINSIKKIKIFREKFPANPLNPRPLSANWSDNLIQRKRFIQRLGGTLWTIWQRSRIAPFFFPSINGRSDFVKWNSSGMRYKVMFQMCPVIAWSRWSA